MTHGRIWWLERWHLEQVLLLVLIWWLGHQVPHAEPRQPANDKKLAVIFIKVKIRSGRLNFMGRVYFLFSLHLFSGPCPFLKQTIWSLLIGQLSFYGFLQMWNNMNRQESERLGSSMMASSNCPKRTRCAVCAPLLMKERGGVVKVGLPKKSICHSEKKSPRHRPPLCGSGFSLTNCLSFCNRSAFVCFVRFTSFVHNLYLSSLITKNWKTF